MLSEHEIIDLLEQLKLGALHGAASEYDPVGHWPVLIGDGLCLSLQSAASAEFVRQPEKVTVVGGIDAATTLAGICSQYRQVHHVSTGLYKRSLLIGYDSQCLSMLPQLNKSQTDVGVTTDAVDDELCHSSFAYDFSLAVAASLDPAAHIDGVNHPVAFLPLEFDDNTGLAGGWRLVLELEGLHAEFFIGLLNPELQQFNSNTISQPDVATALICVQPEVVSRARNASEITVKLGMPELLEWHQPVESEMYQVKVGDDGRVVFEKEEQSLTPQFSADMDLMVQRSLQLSVDDLYLLLVEAIGGGASLNIVFEPAADDCLEDGRMTYVLPQHKRLRCVSINNLPVRNTELLYDGVDFLLKSYD